MKQNLNSPKSISILSSPTARAKSSAAAPKTAKTIILRAALCVIIIFALCLSAALCAACNREAPGITFVSMRSYYVAGVEYECYTFSFPYADDMTANYYEIKVEQRGTVSYIPQGQLYFMQAENAGGTKMRVANSPAYFCVNLPADVKLLKLSLVRCNKASSESDFEVLETVYTATFAV
jgi:hypothetical protein